MEIYILLCFIDTIFIQSYKKTKKNITPNPNTTEN